MINNSRKRACWLLSLLVSLAAILCTIHVWNHVATRYKEGHEVIMNQADLDRVLKPCHTVEFQDGAPPIRIPLGIFVQSFAFVNSNDVNINGYIWMRFPKDLPEGFVEEFVFPEEVDSSSTKTEKIYTVDQGDHTLVGWYFDVVVRQSFDYSEYPLDFHAVWLRVWSKDFVNDMKVVVVPDFSSYNPAALAANWFGLDSDIVPLGWKIRETFYSYKTIHYDTTFGFDKDQPDNDYSELFFNIGIYRNFTDAFIINIIPLFFVLLLLFAMVMMVSADESKRDGFGYNTTNTIGICASLLFVVILLHVQVRQQFIGSKLMYIEYFYLIVYLVIFLTALNSYLISSRKFMGPSAIRAYDEFIVKVCYWPVVLWLMAIATWIKL